MCRRAVGVICLATLLTAGPPLPAFCQDPQASGDVQQTDEDAQQTGESAPQMGQATPEMREMAKAMKSMAEMCEMMMQREMQSRPLWITAGAVLGTVLTVALLLFVVLEIQWIRFWSLRIKTEHKQLEK